MIATTSRAPRKGLNGFLMLYTEGASLFKEELAAQMCVLVSAGIELI